MVTNGRGTDTEATSDEPLFSEKQWFRQPGMWVFIAISAVGSWYAFYRQIIQGTPFGDSPLPDWMIISVVVLFGLTIPALFLLVRLTVEVRTEGVYVRFWPVVRRLIPYEDVRDFELITYNARKEYGGWGIRWVRSKDPRAPRPKPGANKLERFQAYTAKGNRGVELHLATGEEVLVGSREAEEPHSAIKEARGR